MGEEAGDRRAVASRLGQIAVKFRQNGGNFG